ncbi:IL1R1 protein, partial [Oreocharis arfaki]|nr:IL1R1 protein [Oreocharis arfaki]
LFPLEKCEAYDVILRHSLVPDGQPLAIKCSPEKSSKNGDYKVTWYKVGNQTAVPRDKLSRVHQQKNLIWFLPAMLEDSGDYECVIRNLTSCKKMCTKVTVFERIDGLCLNEKFAVEEVIFTSSSAKVVCPHLDYFRNEKNIQPVHWHKDCQPLEGKRFILSNSDLIISNVTVHDRGNYTCETTYTYNGKQYNISRDVTLSFFCLVTPPKKPPEISYPRNNSIEVELGTQVTVDCNTTGADVYEVYWTGNGVYIDVFYMSRIFASPYEGEASYDGRPMHSVKLIISEVSSEDYEQPFVCQASNAFGQVASYIILKHKVPDIRGWLTGGLVSLLILTFITLIIYKIFKIDLVLWYRSSVCALTSKEEMFMFVLDGKIYDAYVLYTKSSEGRSVCCLETFARRILPDVLEKQCGYNLFILGRDDLPGEAVVSVADETLKQSRRLMIILGSETSSCCPLEDTSEQQLAMYNALIRDGIQVILIEMGEIQDYTSMPESIRYIKQKHGAIQWKGDFSEKSCSANTRFWKNVRYQMPSRKKVSYSEVYLLPLSSNSSAAKGS